jgi:hypothetical protein
MLSEFVGKFTSVFVGCRRHWLGVNCHFVSVMRLAARRMSGGAVQRVGYFLFRASLTIFAYFAGLS